ncbi:MAG: DUF2384 domain-containing protein [Spirochaetales bacterium]|nr:DUF2384 domain-containing protein [Spirochaetales bacterium]
MGARRPEKHLLNALNAIRRPDSAVDIYIDDMEMNRLIRIGIPKDLALSVMELLETTKTAFAGLIGTSVRTFDRLAAEDRLKEYMGDKVVHLAALLIHGTRVFGDRRLFLKWLKEPNDALAGQTPLDLVSTQAGIASVDNLVGQIEWGELT